MAYYKLNGNITKEGLTKDLEWMHRAGVAGVAAFTLFAAFVTITRPASHVADVTPVVIGGLAGAAAVLWLFRAAAPQLAQGPLRHGRGGTRRRTR